MNGGNILRAVMSLWDLSYLSTAWTHRVTPLGCWGEHRLPHHPHCLLSTTKELLTS